MKDKHLIKYSPKQAEHIALQFLKKHYPGFNKAPILLHKTDYRRDSVIRFQWYEYQKIGKYVALYPADIMTEVDLVEGVVVEYESDYEEMWALLDDPSKRPKKINVSKEEIFAILQKNSHRFHVPPVKLWDSKTKLKIHVIKGKVVPVWHGLACGNDEQSICYPAVGFSMNAITGELLYPRNVASQ